MYYACGPYPAHKQMLQKYVKTKQGCQKSFNSRCLLILKETVSRDGRGMWLYIIRKLSLNPITSEGNEVILLKGQLAKCI